MRTFPSPGEVPQKRRIPNSTPDGAVVINQARFRAALTFATPTGVAQTTIVP